MQSSRRHSSKNYSSYTVKREKFSVKTNNWVKRQIRTYFHAKYNAIWSIAKFTLLSCVQIFNILLRISNCSTLIIFQSRCIIYRRLIYSQSCQTPSWLLRSGKMDYFTRIPIHDTKGCIRVNMFTWYVESQHVHQDKHFSSR